MFITLITGILAIENDITHLIWGYYLLLWLYLWPDNLNMWLMWSTTSLSETIDTWQIFGPTIEYFAIHSALTENVSIT